MEFEVSHSFPVTPDALAEALLDRAFQASLERIGPLEHREVLAHEEGPGGSVTRRIRCVLGIEISGAAKTMLGGAEPAWVQEEAWDPATRRWEWVIHPEVAHELLSARGSTLVGGDDGAATRTVTGTVRVGVPFYGGKVERWIVEGISEAYDEEAEHLARWLEREK